MEVLAIPEEEAAEIRITRIMGVRGVIAVAATITIITEAVVVAHIGDLVEAIEETADRGQIIRRLVVITT